MAVVVVPKYEFSPVCKTEVHRIFVAGELLNKAIAEGQRRQSHFKDLAQTAAASEDATRALELVNEAAMYGIYLHMVSYLMKTEQMPNFMDCMMLESCREHRKEFHGG